MKYKVYLDAMKCDRFTNKIFKACDLGVDAVGTKAKIVFTMEQKPTKEIIQKIIEAHLKTKEHSDLDSYFDNVKLDRIELLEEEK